MKILIVAGLPESLLNFRGSLIKVLNKAGHEVHVAGPNLDKEPALCAQLRTFGATPHDCFIKRTGMNPVSDLRSLISLISLLRAVRPNVVLAYTVKPVIWGGIASRLIGSVRFYALITGLGYAFIGGTGSRKATVRRLVELLYRVSLLRAAGVIFQNPDDAIDFFERGLLPSTITPQIVDGSGVDTDHFAVTPFPNGPIRFLLIARLLDDKGIREFVQAAAALKNEKASVEFHLVGPLDTNPNALPASLVNHWHDTDVIFWHGGVTDVRPAISSSHVYVLPSYREGTPRSVLEAMSMGRPVITTNAPGCRETVLDGVNGFLVPVRDAEALAGAMRNFIESPELICQMGAKSRRIAEEKYDVRKVNAQMMKALDL